MPEPIVMTDWQRSRLREMREGGATWDAIGVELGFTRYRVIEEGRQMGLRTLAAPVVRKPSAVRRDFGSWPLEVWSEISRGVLADAGLPVPGPGEVW